MAKSATPPKLSAPATQSPSLHKAIARVEAALLQLSRGKYVVVSDSKSRENEGDVIAAAATVTTAQVNFMLRECRGLICSALTAKRAETLKLPLMVPQVKAKLQQAHQSGNAASCAPATAFTLSVDAADVTTGISAEERARTLRLLAAPGAAATAFIRPGHIFPLRAAPNIFIRSGHTEAGVTLNARAGRASTAVICEILNPNGTMARSSALTRFAVKHKFPLLSIQDIIFYELTRHKLLSPLQQLSFQVKPAARQGRAFTNTTRSSHQHINIAVYALQRLLVPLEKPPSGSAHVKPAPSEAVLLTFRHNAQPAARYGTNLFWLSQQMFTKHLVSILPLLPASSLGCGIFKWSGVSKLLQTLCAHTEGAVAPLPLQLLSQASRKLSASSLPAYKNATQQYPKPWDSWGDSLAALIMGITETLNGVNEKPTTIKLVTGVIPKSSTTAASSLKSLFAPFPEQLIAGLKRSGAEVITAPIKNQA